MKERRTGLLLSWPFLCALVTLLANDWYFKSLYGNWLTGKLSDFAGILLFSLLLFALLPRRVRILSWGIAAAFAWWKSPLAQPFIDFVQSVGLTSFGRVVDYSDLTALVMIPLAVAIFRKPPRISQGIHDGWLRNALFGLSLFAITGTSMVPHQESYYLRKAEGTGGFENNEVTALLAKVADKHFLAPYPGSDDSTGGFYGTVDVQYSITEQRTAVKLELVGTDPEKLRAVTADLKQAFGESLENMELVILLPEPHQSRCGYHGREQGEPGPVTGVLPEIDFDMSKAELTALIERRYPAERLYVFKDSIQWRRFDFVLDKQERLKGIRACEPPNEPERVQ